MKITATVLLLISAVITHAQEAPGAAHREAMKKLSALEGKWAGDATIQSGPGKSVKVKQTEDVQFKLGGTLLLVEGVGTGKKGDSEAESVLFNALATISYDAEAKKYKMRANRMEGVSVDPEIDVKDDGFIWRFSPPKSKVTIRYTATIKSDTWVEIGEVSMDDGKSWNKFMEMNLKRVKN